MTARILIIEDNPANLELMNYLLNTFGHDTMTARDGLEGLETAQRESPDLIICDIDLPKLSGFEIARKLKSDTKLRGIPLIAVTAFAMVGDRTRMIAAGFDGYIPKPIAPEDFVGHIEGFLPGTSHTTQVMLLKATQAVSKPKPTRASILVVDNHLVNIELMHSLLEPSGYLVFSTDNVDDGLQMARQTLVDLIISDVHMPEKDGYLFIQAVKADPSLSHIPFMFLSSSHGGDDDLRKGSAFGADRFIVRPIDPKILLTEIESLIGSEGG